jgi:hypothetical protein
MESEVSPDENGDGNLTGYIRESSSKWIRSMVRSMGEEETDTAERWLTISPSLRHVQFYFCSRRSNVGNSDRRRSPRSSIATFHINITHRWNDPFAACNHKQSPRRSRVPRPN